MYYIISRYMKCCCCCCCVNDVNNGQGFLIRLFVQLSISFSGCCCCVCLFGEYCTNDDGASDSSPDSQLKSFYDLVLGFSAW